MTKVELLEVLKAKAKAEFISRELSRYYACDGGSLGDVAVRIHTEQANSNRFAPGGAMLKRMAKVTEYLSDIYDEVVAPFYEEEYE